MTHKEAASAFLQMCSGGQVREAFERFVSPTFVHHNPHFPAGAGPLIEGMIAASKANPHQVLLEKHVVSDGNLVAVHSHVRPTLEAPGYSAVHLLRFESDRVVELWDVVMALPGKSPNAGGAF